MTDTVQAVSTVPGAPPGDQGRLSSGIPGLDAILCGGFVRNALYIAQGMPGAGKTIFGNQICALHVAGGGRAMYVTMLSEQHERMFANLAQMSFFDASRIGTDLVYVSAFQLLQTDGLPGLLSLLRREIIRLGVTMLVLDGLLAAEPGGTFELDMKKFMHELQMLAGVCDCTMFLLTSGRDNSIAAQDTMVDGLIDIGTATSGWRLERHVAVRKFRGSDFIGGCHSMRITSDGIVVWPRLEALLHSPERRHRDPASPRATTGVEGLDTMLRGGLPVASSTLVMGPTGTGKTVLGMQFIAGCTEAEPGLILGFYETPEQLLARCATLAPTVPALFEAGIVDMIWQSPSEDLMDRVGAEMIAAVKARGVRRLLIDGLLGFQDMTVQPDRLIMFYRAITNLLRSLNVTVMSTMEVPELIGPVMQAPVKRLTPIAENLIVLRYVEEDAMLKRLLSVMKVRDGDFDHRLRAFTIERGGIVLKDGFEGTVGALSGTAMPLPAATAGHPPDPMSAARGTT